uniref:Putative TonB-dependent receptor family protein n=2 Tax=termite gut metagenome TaxID=433724 RepID=S0DFJ2_9ZZZZ
MRNYLHKASGSSFGSKFRLIALSLAAMIFMAGSAYAQEGSVGGTVLDEEGNPIVGATVLVKGSMNVAISRVSGEFVLTNVDVRNAVLSFSYVGYKPQDVVLGGRSNVDVTLEQDINRLEDVIVVGYGSLSKKELSSSIVQVSKDDFNQGAVNNAMEMLTGKVAGLNVNTQSPADPNSGSDLQIRGAASLLAGNEPLVIVDGVAGGSLRALSPQDIASMTVLKDAASTAIYGTRGANGVVLITTTRGGGVSGVQVTYDSYFAANIAKARPEVLTPDEFRRSKRGTDYGYDTDWYSLLMRDFSYDHNQYLSIDGSSKSGNYGASFNWKDAKGMDIKTARKEYGGRFYVEQRMLNNRLQINGSLYARRVNEIWGSNQFDNALNTNPTMPVYNEDGTYYQPTSPTNARNPVSEVKLVDMGGQRLYVLGAVDAKLNIIQNSQHSLNTTLSYSMNYNDLKQGEYVPSTAADSYWGGYKGRAEVRYQKWWKDRVEWVFNYSMDIGDHSIRAVAGYNWEDDNWEQIRARNNDFAFDNMGWNNIGAGSYLAEGNVGDGRVLMESGKSNWRLAGVFARVNYNWKDLLMASVAFRYEGVTKFGANNKWGTFPSVSLAWEIANMDFMENHRDVVQSLKLRASFGVAGRSDIEAYRSLTTYSQNSSYFMDGEWVQGYRPSINANPNLAWEKSQDTNIGVDFVLWDRLSGSIDLYDRQSVDLLYNYTAPQPPFVYNTILVNVGTIQNRGIEVSLNYDVFKKSALKWTTGVNWSWGQTTLKKLSSDVFKLSYLQLYLKPGVGTSEYFFRVQEGAKIGQFYGYEYAGVEDGNMLIYDNDGNKVPVGEADMSWKRYIGNGTPQHYLSWSNHLSYKNFDLDLFFTGAFGFEIFNMRKYGMGLQGAGTANVLRTAYTTDKDVRTGGGVISSYFLEKGDYFKLQNVTLGYNVPLRSKVVDGLRIYLSAKNVFTLTGYTGNDPSIVRTTGIEPGVDISGAYPLATQISLGVTLRFK